MPVMSGPAATIHAKPEVSALTQTTSDAYDWVTVDGVAVDHRSLPVSERKYLIAQTDNNLDESEPSKVHVTA